MTLIIFLLGIAGAFFTISYIYRESELIKSLIITPAVYFSLYIISAGLYIWINHFSVLAAQLTVIAIEAIICIALHLITKQGLPRFKATYIKYIPLAIIIVVLAFISHRKAELFSTSQDQGLYQEKAMMYMYDHNSNVLSFDEFFYIDDLGQQIVYITQLDEMDGIYLRNASIGTEDCTTEYEIHGVATFAALLALWGKMFGLHNMTGILSVFYLTAIGLVWLLCENLGLKNYVSSSVAMLTGVCPIVLWCSQNILTEIGLSMIVALFFVFITEKNGSVTIWSALPVIAFAYYHVTIIYILPMFAVIYLFMYFAKKQRGMLWAIVIALWGYMGGLAMMYSSSPLYMSKNMANVFLLTKDLLTDSNYRKIVFVICVIITVVLAILELTKVTSKLIAEGSNKISEAKKSKAYVIVFSILMLVCVAYHIFLCIKSTKYGLNILNQSIIGVVIMSGYIMLPLALVSTFIKPSEKIKTPGMISVIIGLIYFMLIPLGFVFFSVYRYYYYARYFAPYMMLVFVVAAMAANGLKPKFVIPITAIICGILVWQNIILYTDRDMTYGDFEIVEGIADAVDENDCVVMIADTNKMCNMLMIPVKATTDADIYFVDYSGFDNQMQELASRYEDVYMLMYDAGFIDDGSQPWEYVYKSSLASSIYEVIDDGMPFPKKPVVFNSGLGLFRYTGELVGY